MFIDFSEITDKHDFELFCAHLLETIGYRIIKAPSLGNDHGIDIICEAPVEHAEIGYRWAVSCKHSKNSLGVGDDTFDPFYVRSQLCSGFMAIYSSRPTSGLDTKLSRIGQPQSISVKVFSGRDIERVLIGKPECYPVFRQYFPRSFHSLIGSKRNNYCECCNQELNPLDRIFLVSYVDTHTRAVVTSQVGPCCFDGLLTHLQETGVAHDYQVLRDDGYY